MGVRHRPGPAPLLRRTHRRRRYCWGLGRVPPRAQRLVGRAVRERTYRRRAVRAQLGLGTPAGTRRARAAPDDSQHADMAWPRRGTRRGSGLHAGRLPVPGGIPRGAGPLRSLACHGGPPSTRLAPAERRTSRFGSWRTSGSLARCPPYGQPPPRRRRLYRSAREPARAFIGASEPAVRAQVLAVADTGTQYGPAASREGFPHRAAPAAALGPGETLSV